MKISKIDDPDKYGKIKRGLKKFDIDGLIIAGGDDTGSVMCDLIERGIKCIHVPKTMDLDLQPYSVGGDSTINKIAVYLDELKTTGRTHNRIIVMEVFGRNAGHSAFRGGIAGGVDAVLIPEIEAGTITRIIVSQRVAPRAREASLRATGTLWMASSEILQMVGIDIKASIKEALKRFRPVGKSKTSCRKGATKTIPKNPITTEGRAARSSTTGLTTSLTLSEAISAR